MDPFTIAVLVTAGLLAGFLNTLAGGGSVLTIPALEYATGSPGLANATNRVALLLQNIVAVRAFQKGGALPKGIAVRCAIPAVFGGILGAWIATVLPPQAMRTALAVAVVLVALTTVLRTPKTPRLGARGAHVAFFFVGIYMGFLQAGAGFALLACLVGGLSLDLVRANAAKVFIVLVTTVGALFVFGLKGQVRLLPGLVCAAGNMTGAFLGTRVALVKGAAWIRPVIVLAAIIAVVKLLAFPSG